MEEREKRLVSGQKHAGKSFAFNNGVQYYLKSPIAAIDTVFKSFYAIPWIVIQRRIFDISGESDTKFPSVNTLISDLKSSSA